MAFDRKRKGKKLSNKDWKSPEDEDARITKLKDGRTNLAHKPEHVVDLDSGAIVSAKIHHADQGDTTTNHSTLKDARSKLKKSRKRPLRNMTTPLNLWGTKGTILARP